MLIKIQHEQTFTSINTGEEVIVHDPYKLKIRGDKDNEELVITELSTGGFEVTYSSKKSYVTPIGEVDTILFHEGSIWRKKPVE